MKAECDFPLSEYFVIYREAADIDPMQPTRHYKENIS